MTKWKSELDLTPEWGKASNGEITARELAAVIASRLSRIRNIGDDWLDEEKEAIAEQFLDLSEDVDAGTDHFDDLMSDLYDWADTKISGDFFNAVKACWVKTF